MGSLNLQTSKLHQFFIKGSDLGEWDGEYILKFLMDAFESKWAFRVPAISSGKIMRTNLWQMLPQMVCVI